MNWRNRRFALATVVMATLALIAVGCQEGTSPDSTRLKKMETTVGQVSGITTRLSQLEDKGEGIEGRVAAVQSSLLDLQVAVDAAKETAASAKAGDADLKKKIDDVSARVAPLNSKMDALSGRVGALSEKVGSVEQRTALLETRYADHLRKFHGGG